MDLRARYDAVKHRQLSEDPIRQVTRPRAAPVGPHAVTAPRGAPSQYSGLRRILGGGELVQALAGRSPMRHDRVHSCCIVLAREAVDRLIQLRQQVRVHAFQYVEELPRNPYTILINY